MSRWNDKPDDSPDDWRGWINGKYDGRYGGHPYAGKESFGTERPAIYFRPAKNKGFKIAIAIIIPLVLGAILFYFVNPSSLNPDYKIPANEESDLFKTNEDFDIIKTDCTMTSNGLGDIILSCAGENYNCKSNSPLKSAIQKAGIIQDVTLRIADKVCQIEYVDNTGDRIAKSFIVVSEDVKDSITMPKKDSQNNNEKLNQVKIPKINISIPSQEDINKKIQETTNTIKHTAKTVPIITKRTFDTARIESLIYTYTNEQRSQNGLHKLILDPKLTAIAKAHSNDMADRNYLSHYNPEGLDPTARGLRNGYNCHKELGGGYYAEGIAENIAQNWLYTSYMTRGIYTSYNWHSEESLARDIVDGWMSSAGHRQNILTATYDRIGIGVAISEDDAVYATQDFC